MSKKIKIHRYVKNKEAVFASVLVGVISIVRIKVNIMFKLQLVEKREFENLWMVRLWERSMNIH